MGSTTRSVAGSLAGDSSLERALLDDHLMGTFTIDLQSSGDGPIPVVLDVPGALYESD